MSIVQVKKSGIQRYEYRCCHESVKRSYFLFHDYKENGFKSTLILSKEIAISLGMEHVFREKWIIIEKINFMTMSIKRQHNLSKNLLILIIYYL